MSQEAVERTIGKLATDAEFCARFFVDPAVATWEAGLRLSTGEIEALSALSPAAVTRFSQSLDSRIVRLRPGGLATRPRTPPLSGDSAPPDGAT